MTFVADRSKLDQSQVRRILVIKLRAIGDVLLSTVVLPNLRAAYPDAHISFLTDSPARGVVEGRDDIDRAIIFHPKHDNILRLFVQLYRERFDLAIDLFCNPRSAQMCFATRAPIRVGYPFRGRAWAYTTHVNQRSGEVHNTEFNLDALRHMGIPIVDQRVTMPVSAADFAWADDMLEPLRATGRRVLAVNPSGTWATKRWPLEKFASLCDVLVREDGVLPVLVWGPGEESDVQRIRSLMHEEAVIAPPSTLTQLAALLARCDAMISNDAGPMHIGAATGIPVLGIFGPTNPLLQGPFNARSSWVRHETLPCIACNRTSCDIGTICMTELGVDAVAHAYRTLVQRELA
jgi:ADP-heptose:LPS heptosyltransferase